MTRRTSKLLKSFSFAVFALAVEAALLGQLEHAALEQRRHADDLVEHQRAAIGQGHRPVDGTLAAHARRGAEQLFGQLALFAARRTFSQAPVPSAELSSKSMSS